MKWYYVENGQQAGPVEESQLTELVQSGKLRGDTLVWHEGMTAWQVFSAVKSPEITLPDAATAGASASAGETAEAVCAECQNIFRKEDMIRHKDVYVCANCKPVFMQKLGEGVALSGSGSNRLTEQQILEREYVIDIGEAIARGWDIFKNNVGTIIAAQIVLGMVFFICWAVSVVVSLVVPLANTFISVLYTAPLTAGLLWLFLRLARGEAATLGDAFAGFSSKYPQLLLFGLIQLLVTIVCLLPVFAVALGFGLSSGMFKPGSPPPDMAAGVVIGVMVAGLIGVCGIAYINTLFTYALLLIMDKNYRFWPAIQLSRKMVSRRWWMTFFFLFVGQFISGLGAIACLVGVLVTFPIFVGMKVALYDRNFRELVPQA